MKYLFGSKHIHPIIRIILFGLITAILFGVIIIPINQLMSILELNPYGKGYMSLIAFFIEYSLMPIAVILGTYIALKVLENKSMRFIGLKFDKNTFKEIMIGFLLAFFMTGVIFIIEYLFGWIKVKGLAWNYRSIYDYIIFLFKSLILYVSVALVEEISIRGYLLHELENYKGKAFAIIVSSIIFGLLHINNAIGTWAIYIVPFSLSLLGVLFAFLFYTKRSLWMPIAFHFSWNFFEYEFFSLTGYGEKRSIFFVTELTGPKFWVGLPKSSFGPEVGGLGVIIALIGIFIIGQYMRKRKKATDIKTSVK